jgi:hypothetical protein
MVRNWAVKHESEERVEAFWTLTHDQGADMKLMVPALVSVFAFGLASNAIAEGSGPGGSEGGMEGGAQSQSQGGENGAEIDHSENTGSGIVKGHAADTGPGNPNVPDPQSDANTKKP